MRKKVEMMSKKLSVLCVLCAYSANSAVKTNRIEKSKFSQRTQSIILLFLFLSLAAQAQKRALPLSVFSAPLRPLRETADNPEQKKKQKAKFLLSFDNYRSFISSRPVSFSGLKIGIEWPRKFRWGFGFYAMKRGLPLEPIQRADYSIDQKFNFSYASTYFEYVLYEDFRWEVSIPVSIGTGWGKVDTVSTLYNTSGTRHSDTVTVFTQGLAAHYKVFYWLGVGVGAGYREIITDDKFVHKQLNGPFYALKIKLFLGGLYKAIFKRDVVRAERDEYRKKKKDNREKRKQKREDKKAAKQ